MRHNRAIALLPLLTLLLLPLQGRAEVSMFNGTFTFTSILELQGGYKDPYPWRPEIVNGAGVYFALARASVGNDMIRGTLGIASGAECQAVGAIRPINHLCIQEAKLIGVLHSGRQVKVSLTGGSDITPFGIATIGPGRTGNPGLLTLSSLTLPYTSLGLSGKIEAANGRWSVTAGTSTWNGAIPTDGPTAIPATYIAVTVSPFNKTGEDTPDPDVNFTGYYTFLPDPHPLGWLHAGDLSIIANRGRLALTAEIHGGSASSGKDRWVCGSFLPGVWLYRGTVSPLLIGLFEGCKEDVEEGTTPAALGALKSGGSTWTAGGGIRVPIQLPGVQVNLLLMIRHEHGPDGGKTTGTLTLQIAL